MTRAELTRLLDEAGVIGVELVNSHLHPHIVRVRIGPPDANHDRARDVVEASDGVRILHGWYEDERRRMVLRVALEDGA